MRRRRWWKPCHGGEKGLFCCAEGVLIKCTSAKCFLSLLNMLVRFYPSKSKIAENPLNSKKWLNKYNHIIKDFITVFQETFKM